MSKIKAGIFDVGGVLCPEVMSEVHKEIIKSLEILEEDYWKAWDVLYPELSCGKITEDTFWEDLRNRTHFKSSLPKESLLLHEYSRRFAPNGEVLEIVKRLKRKGYKLAVVSNTIKPHTDFNLRMGVYDEFPIRVLSNEVGFRKPDKKMYLIALEKLGVEPEEVFFVDDKKENVDAAINLGIHGLLFKDAISLERDLENLGVEF